METMNTENQIPGKSAKKIMCVAVELYNNNHEVQHHNWSIRRHTLSSFSFTRTTFLAFFHNIVEELHYCP